MNIDENDEDDSVYIWSDTFRESIYCEVEEIGDTGYDVDASDIDLHDAQREAQHLQQVEASQQEDQAHAKSLSEEPVNKTNIW